MDLNGNVILPFEYDNIKLDDMDIPSLKVQKDEKCGVIDLNGMMISPFE